MRGLYLGRFQPFHNGHLELVHHLQRTFRPQELLLVIGSAQASYTPRDPFTAGERLEMIRRTLKAERVPDTYVIPVPDIDRHPLWVEHVASYTPRFDQVYTNDPLSRHLFQEAGYDVPSLPFFNRGSFEGTEVRRRMAEGEDWRALVPSAVATFLDEIQGLRRIQASAGHASTDRAGGTRG